MWFWQQTRRPFQSSFLRMLGFVFLAGCLAAPSFVSAKSFILYAGSYTSGSSKGIYAWRFNSKNGTLDPLGLEARTPQPAHIWASPDQKTLYAVNWEDNGGVSAFHIDTATGALTFLNRVSAKGRQPNQVMVDPSGRIAVSVNYTTGNVAAYRIQPDGSLSESFWVDQHTGQPLSAKQPGPKTHGIAFSRDGRFMYIADLGLDRVYGYEIDARKGVITPGDPPFTNVEAGAGPRRIQISANGRFLYVNHETDSKVSVFSVKGTSLTEIQRISTLPAGFQGKNTTAEIVLSQDGRFLYVSNRGSDSIAIFKVDQISGELTKDGIVSAGGSTPRNLRLDPTGNYLLSADEGSGEIVVFKVDRATGQLSETGFRGEIDTPGGLYFISSDNK